jgi:hypothetical protein
MLDFSSKWFKWFHAAAIIPGILGVSADGGKLR